MNEKYYTITSMRLGEIGESRFHVTATAKVKEPFTGDDGKLVTEMPVFCYAHTGTAEELVYKAVVDAAAVLAHMETEGSDDPKALEKRLRELIDSVRSK